MMARSALLTAAVALLIVGCSTSNGTPESALPSTTPTPSPQDASVTVDAQTEDTDDGLDGEVSGSFFIDNTSGGAVGVDVVTLRALIESDRDGDWRPVTAQCSFDPTPPFTVETSLEVGFTCVAADSVPLSDALRASIEATVEGSDEVFRLDAQVDR